MKVDWQHATLGSVAQVGAGNSAPQGDAFFADGIYPFFRTSDAGRVRFGDISESNDYLNEDGIKGLRRLPTGTILFPKSGASTFLNHRVMMGVDGYVSSHLATIVGDESKVDRRFLLYFLSTVFAQDLVQDHAYPSLNLPLIAGIPVAFPTLPEQRRIVAILDEAFDGITTAKANAKKNLQNARALFENHLQSVFTERGEGWEEKSLEELGTITSSKRIFKSEYVKSGVPFYRTKEIKELANGRTITTELFISEARYREIKTGFGVPKEGDVLLTAIGTIGEIWVVDGNNDFYFKDGNVLWLKEFASINPHFLKYVLLSFVESLNKMSHGSAYSALPIQRLNAHKIFLPSLAAQEQIIATLDSLRDETQRLETIYQQKLSALDALKKSLLHQAFSGQL